jgi:hypothetical protein
MQRDIKLVKPYFSKKLEANTIKTVLASPYQTAYRLYLMVNGIDEIQEFYEDSNDRYFIHATIRTIATPIGDAKRQIWSVTHLQPIIKQKPRWVIKCSVTDKQTNVEKFRLHCETLKESEVYNTIAEAVSEIELIALQ